MTGFLRLMMACTAVCAIARAETTDLAAAEAAFRRDDHAAIVKVLLPSYRKGMLEDPRGLYLLSRGCFFAKPSPLKGLFAALDRSCSGQSGKITVAAAEAGSVDAMLDLSFTLFKPGRYLAHGDLRPDPVRAYGWALLAGSLASNPEDRAKAEQTARTIRSDLVRRNGDAASSRLDRETAEARARFTRLAPRIRPDLAPADGKLSHTDDFRTLGWVDIPGTADVSELSEGADSLYLPTLREDHGHAIFHVSLSGVDTWRIARMNGDCATSKAILLEDSGWQGDAEDDSTVNVAVLAAGGGPWGEDSRHVALVVDFACLRARANAAAATTR
jgi:hypothetical protein